MCDIRTILRAIHDPHPQGHLWATALGTSAPEWKLKVCERLRTSTAIGPAWCTLVLPPLPTELKPASSFDLKVGSGVVFVGFADGSVFPVVNRHSPTAQMESLLRFVYDPSLRKAVPGLTLDEFTDACCVHWCGRTNSFIA